MKVRYIVGRKTFFDALERELDLQKEYVKIDSLILTTTNWYGQTFNSCIEYYFKNCEYPSDDPIQ